ncbi:hypothetical protein FisN_28Hu052 [Fistulifera solaris]|uniref:Uncharacterized protein n=1 Tax=Fistulifera solaris TaxID=1519565 RepID=A0A1Z5KH04_FISSO|nr:hypothetical protein FisN_28Hu052 [Fistulifera solaris]|eukprot:GAX25583.1 hypothetical protein FisN_28Hu052 [Fistulifera solaris]
MPNTKRRHKKGKEKQPNQPPAPQLFQRLKSMFPAKTISPAPSDGGYHLQYKEATLSFHNWMAKAWPALRMTAVDDYRRGVDFIVEHNMKLYLQNEEVPHWIVAPPDILASLAVSIYDCEKK